MTAEAFVIEVVEALAALSVPYMIVGSFSSNLYGIPRSTQDADFVVRLGDVPPSAIAARLGPGFRLDPQVSFESITATVRYLLYHPASAFKVELFLLGDDPHDQKRFARRRMLSVSGREVYFPSPEDVVVTKLRWSQRGRRAKDLEDLQDVINVQGDALDLDYTNLV